MRLPSAATLSSSSSGSALSEAGWPCGAIICAGRCSAPCSCVVCGFAGAAGVARPEFFPGPSITATTVWMGTVLPSWTRISRAHRRPARNLGVDFVGGDFEQRLVALDFIAGLFQPLGDGALEDAFAHLGHDDVDRQRQRSSPVLAFAAPEGTRNALFLAVDSRGRHAGCAPR